MKNRFKIIGSLTVLFLLLSASLLLVDGLNVYAKKLQTIKVNGRLSAGNMTEYGLTVGVKQRMNFNNMIFNGSSDAECEVYIYNGNGEQIYYSYMDNNQRNASISLTMSKGKYTIQIACLKGKTDYSIVRTSYDLMKISKKTLRLGLKGKNKLTIKNAIGKVKWKSSNKKIVTVSKKGVVKGKREGKAIIRGKVKGRVFKCKVHVVRIKYKSAYRGRGFRITAKYNLDTGRLNIKIKNTGKNDIYLARNWGSEPIFTFKTSRKTIVKKIDFIDDDKLDSDFQEIGPGMSFKYQLKSKGKPEYLKINGIMPLDSMGLPINGRKKYVVKIRF